MKRIKTRGGYDHKLCLRRSGRRRIAGRARCRAYYWPRHGSVDNEPGVQFNWKFYETKTRAKAD